MAKTIPQLTDATTVNAADELIIQQSGITKRATASEMLNDSAIVTATGSTTARSLAARAADVVNVRDFGAVGDGVADDTAAIQAAIDVCCARDAGGRVVIPSGVYKINGTLMVQKNEGANTGTGVSIVGSGKDNTRLMQYSLTANTIEFRSMNFSGVSDLFIGHAAPAATTSGYAVVIRNSPTLPSSGLGTWAKNLWLSNMYNGFFVQSIAEARIEHVAMRGLRGTRGVLFQGTVGKPSFGLWCNDVTSEANYGGGTNTELDHFVYDSYAYSFQLTKCTGLNGKRGVLMLDSANETKSYPRWLFASGLELDFNTGNAMLVNGGEGVYLTNSWLSSSQGDSGFYTGANFRGEVAISTCRFVWNKFHGIVLQGGREIIISNSIIGDNGFGIPTSVTISNASPAVVTYASNHNLQNGQPIRLTTTGTLPLPLVATPSAEVGSGTIYYVVNKTDTTFQLATSVGGSPINTTTDGTGNHSVRPIAYHGMAVIGGVDEFIVTGCAIGDTLLQTGNTQRHGIFISAESSADFVIANNVMRGNVVSPINNNSTAVGSITGNIGYNPVGIANVTVTPSPMTYTAGSTPETLYISGGTVSNVTVGGQSLFSATNCTVRLGCGQAATITYSSAPTIKKYVD